ncbi:MAG: hypothetical protein U0942_00540 [Parvibaculum sp.]|uniref:hypothetical protein n=1 Tax=Parvibaculum sp. TaxID=2024848 RepID=UPI002AB88967|nr:hypothetical protein [Parvibaculum sp.]MDZ4379809.1 hypothetical protein [Parvibaculum sp.]
MLDLLREIERELGGHPDELNEAERRDAAATRRAVARVVRALAVVVALLLAFSSEQLVTWVNGFEVGRVQDRVVAASAAWNALMEESGLTVPAGTVRAEVDELRGMSWPEVRTRLENEKARGREGARLLRGALFDGQG